MNIEQLVLRIPGMSKSEAGRLAEEVSLGLAGQAHQFQTGGDLGDLNVSLSLSPQMPRQRLAGEIVNAVVRSIQSQVAIQSKVAIQSQVAIQTQVEGPKTQPQ